MPRYISRRGARRQQTFFYEEDYRAYLRLMAEWCSNWKVEVWAYCLMPNHVHLIAVPPSKEALAGAVAEAHRRYTCRVNLREDWSGHLWQERFSSFPLDETHLFTATRYIELNPVRAGLVEGPWQYPWSSAAAHLSGCDDRLARVKPLLKMFRDWREYLARDIPEEDVQALKRYERTGRPLGGAAFLAGIEEAPGRALRPRKSGQKDPGGSRRTNN